MVELSGRDVFEILARTHAPMLRAYLLSAVRRESDADDLFQEVLIAAWRALPTYDRTRPFGPWLRGIAFNKISDWRHARRPDLLCDGATLALIDRRFARLDSIAGDTWEEKTAALRACLDELEGDDRRVVDLHYADGQSCESIAQTLQQGMEWVKKRLQRARGRLGLCIDGRLSIGGTP